ncbi:thioredoxin-dependent thiol peroxidase [soil metagenome]|nr:thioredoxin-dependent thiol peroxidase [Chloroflexia bacterium]
MSSKPTVGQPAPEFSLHDANDRQVSLSALKGRPVILYFYPKDDTPGCTKEACSFRDFYGEIQNTGAEVYGASPDSPESHRAFAEKYNLNFPLLSDEDKSAAQDYGVWVERERNGKKSMGIARTTFAIDEKGAIAQVWENVSPDTHGAEIVDWLKSR